MLAGSWAAFLYLLGASATISWVAQPTLLIPAALGAFAGTYVGVWWNRKGSGNKQKEKN